MQFHGLVKPVFVVMRDEMHSPDECSESSDVEVSLRCVNDVGVERLNIKSMRLSHSCEAPWILLEPQCKLEVAVKLAPKQLTGKIVRIDLRFPDSLDSPALVSEGVRVVSKRTVNGDNTQRPRGRGPSSRTASPTHSFSGRDTGITTVSGDISSCGASSMTGKRRAESDLSYPSSPPTSTASATYASSECLLDLLSESPLSGELEPSPFDHEARLPPGLVGASRLLRPEPYTQGAPFPAHPAPDMDTAYSQLLSGPLDDDEFPLSL